MQKLIDKIRSQKAVIGIIGLGYVGLPLVIRFAEEGFKVLGFDVDIKKVKSITAGKSYIKHIPDTNLKNLVKKGYLNATTDFKQLKKVDAVAIFFLEADPGLVVLGEGKHGLEFLLRIPVLQLCTVQQHHAAGHTLVHQALGAGTHTAHDGLAMHIPVEQLPHIAGGENIGVYDHCPSLVVHELWWHKAGGCERLQIIVQPGALNPVA